MTDLQLPAEFQRFVVDATETHMTLNALRTETGERMCVPYLIIPRMTRYESDAESLSRYRESRGKDLDPNQNVSRDADEIVSDDSLHNLALHCISTWRGLPYPELTNKFGHVAAFGDDIGVRATPSFRPGCLILRKKNDPHLTEWRWLGLAVVGNIALLMGWVHGLDAAVYNNDWWRGDRKNLLTWQWWIPHRDLHPIETFEWPSS